MLFLFAVVDLTGFFISSPLTFELELCLHLIFCWRVSFPSGRTLIFLDAGGWVNFFSAWGEQGRVSAGWFLLEGCWRFVALEEG